MNAHPEDASMTPIDAAAATEIRAELAAINRLRYTLERRQLGALARGHVDRADVIEMASDLGVIEAKSRAVHRQLVAALAD